MTWSLGGQWYWRPEMKSLSHCKRGKELPMCGALAVLRFSLRVSQKIYFFGLNKIPEAIATIIVSMQFNGEWCIKEGFYENDATQRVKRRRTSTKTTTVHLSSPLSCAQTSCQSSLHPPWMLEPTFNREWTVRIFWKTVYFENVASGLSW